MLHQITAVLGYSRPVWYTDTYLEGIGPESCESLHREDYGIFSKSDKRKGIVEAM